MKKHSSSHSDRRKGSSSSSFSSRHRIRNSRDWRRTKVQIDRDILSTYWGAPNVPQLLRHQLVGDTISIMVWHACNPTNVYILRKYSLNLSNSYWTSKEVLEALQTSAVAKKVILSVGYMECKMPSFSLNEYMDNIKDIIAELKRKGCQKIIMTNVPPCAAAGLRTRYWYNIMHLNSALKRLCDTEEYKDIVMCNIFQLFCEPLNYQRRNEYVVNGAKNYKIYYDMYNTTSRYSPHTKDMVTLSYKGRSMLLKHLKKTIMYWSHKSSQPKSKILPVSNKSNANDGFSYHPPQNNQNIYPPPQSSQNIYPPQLNQNIYPPHGNPNSYPPQSNQNGYPPQSNPNNYHPQSNQTSYRPQNNQNGYLYANFYNGNSFDVFNYYRPNSQNTNGVVVPPTSFTLTHVQSDTMNQHLFTEHVSIGLRLYSRVPDASATKADANLVHWVQPTDSKPNSKTSGNKTNTNVVQWADNSKNEKRLNNKKEATVVQWAECNSNNEAGLNKKDTIVVQWAENKSNNEVGLNIERNADAIQWVQQTDSNSKKDVIKVSNKNRSSVNILDCSSTSIDDRKLSAAEKLQIDAMKPISSACEIGAAATANIGEEKKLDGIQSDSGTEDEKVKQIEPPTVKARTYNEKTIHNFFCSCKKCFVKHKFFLEQLENLTNELMEDAKRNDGELDEVFEINEV